jgi:ADP-ribose pyrophosphatase YjhB (NUDIX family)
VRPAGRSRREIFMDLRKKKVVATLLFPIRGSEVLLARKTRKIGAGLWNGWGGSIEKGETIRETAVRELRDESGLSTSLKDLEYRGKVTFHNQKSHVGKFDVEVHMFLLRRWSGIVKPNSEMKDPTFWPIQDLPFDEMMPSDKDWLPLILSGTCIEGEVWHGKSNTSLLKPTEIRFPAGLGMVD